MCVLLQEKNRKVTEQILCCENTGEKVSETTFHYDLWPAHFCVGLRPITWLTVHRLDRPSAQLQRHGCSEPWSYIQSSFTRGTGSGENLSVSQTERQHVWRVPNGNNGHRQLHQSGEGGRWNRYGKAVLKIGRV